MDMEKSFHVLIASLSILGLIASPGFADEAKALSSEMSDNGCFSLDGGGYRLISKDMLGVKDSKGSYLYFIPEEESPPFATLLYPTNPGKQREIPLELDRREEDAVITMSCQGKRPGLLEFTKKCVTRGATATISVDYALAGTEGSHFEYLLELPNAICQDAKCAVRMADGRNLEMQANSGDAIAAIKELTVSSKFGSLSFRFSGEGECELRSSALPGEKPGQGKHLVLKSTARKGGLLIDLSFKNTGASL